MGDEGHTLQAVTETRTVAPSPSLPCALTVFSSPCSSVR